MKESVKKIKVLSKTELKSVKGGSEIIIPDDVGD